MLTLSEIFKQKCKDFYRYVSFYTKIILNLPDILASFVNDGFLHTFQNPFLCVWTLLSYAIQYNNLQKYVIFVKFTIFSFCSHCQRGDYISCIIVESEQQNLYNKTYCGAIVLALFPLYAPSSGITPLRLIFIKLFTRRGLSLISLETNVILFAPAYKQETLHLPDNVNRG